MRKLLLLGGCMFLLTACSFTRSEKVESNTTSFKEVSTTAKENDMVKINQPWIAVTFDDGPHPKYTEQILAILKEYDAKATFFMLGKNVDTYPDIVKKVAADGHEIGNHSYTHPDLMKISKAERVTEIQSTQESVKNITNKSPRWLRPPYGSSNNKILEADSGMDLAFWHVDTRDWESRNAANILDVCKKNIGPGKIILFHDLYESSVEGFRQLMETYHKEYRFVTVSELMDHGKDAK